MITYNHESYIEDAINGVLKQNTNFPFELIIANDASSDKTDIVIRNVVKRYTNGNIVKYFSHDENLGMVDNCIFGLKQCKGKYIALCEGDDFWTDQFKLQRQIKFLESNPKLVGCFSDASTINSSGEITGNSIFDENKKEVSIADIGSFWMPTLTVCFRSMYLNTIINSPQFGKVNNGDMFLYYILSQFGNFGYVQTCPSYYRMHPGGVWSGLKVINQYEKNQVSNYIIYDELLPEFKNVLIERIRQNYSWQLGYFRNTEHITYIFKFLNNNFPELFKRKLFEEAFRLLILTFPLLMHRVNLRLIRIFKH